MKQLSPRGRESISMHNRRGKATWPIILLLGSLCTLSQGVLGAEEASRVSPAQTQEPHTGAALRAALDETEQKLATITAERDQLNELLSQAKSNLGETEKSLRKAMEERDNVKEQLTAEKAARDEAEKALAAATTEKDDVKDQLASEQTARGKAEETLAAVTSERDGLKQQLTGEQTERGKAEQALAAVTAERDRLAGDLSQLQEEHAKLSDLLAQIRSTAGGLREEVAEMQGKLPGTLGGTAALTSLEGDAKGLAVELRKVHKALRRNPEDPMLLEQADTLSTALGEKQLLVASATQASGLYRLRPEDTLAIVAARFYGEGNRWPVIYRANTHVLENPDRIIPGLTLVLP